MRVTAATTTSELAREINRHPGFRATVWGRRGLRRVYIRRYRYVWRERDIDESLETEFTVYVEFRPDSIPILTVKEADMVTKSPQWECMMVSSALSRAGIHVESKPTPLSSPYHLVSPDDSQSLTIGGMDCRCISGPTGSSYGGY